MFSDSTGDPCARSSWRRCRALRAWLITPRRCFRLSSISRRFCCGWRRSSPEPRWLGNSCASRRDAIGEELDAYPPKRVAVFRLNVGTRLQLLENPVYKGNGSFVPKTRRQTRLSTLGVPKPYLFVTRPDSRRCASAERRNLYRNQAHPAPPISIGQGSSALGVDLRQAPNPHRICSYRRVTSLQEVPMA